MKRLSNSINRIFPEKLKSGDNIRIISPVRSLKIVSPQVQNIATKRLEQLGFNISFGKHVNECDEFDSSTIASRIEDLHEAFEDPSVNGILTVLGGFNSNQLLRYIDWNIIKNNPKVFCGFSDVTVINNALFTKTGLVNYSGPHYSTFGQQLYFDNTLDYFKKCLMSNKPFEIKPSDSWSDDAWYCNQEDRNLIKNDGFLTINEGSAKGKIIGGNLTCFRHLQGTEYFPHFDNSILFIEDDGEAQPHHFDSHLQALVHSPEFYKVKGIVLGRFQKTSTMTNEKLIKIIKTKKELDSIPFIANVDFGHTSPMITLPIGGTAEISIGNDTKIKIVKH